jgi:hypothetical protein
MSNEYNNNYDTFIKSGVLFKCFIPANETSGYNPNIDHDVYAVNEAEALEYLINEADFSPMFSLPNAIYEIPKFMREQIDKTNRQRRLIQRKLQTGSIDEIRDIRLIFVEIAIDNDDVCKIAEEWRERSNDKYIRLSLTGRKFSVTAREKYIRAMERETVIHIKNLILSG